MHKQCKAMQFFAVKFAFVLVLFAYCTNHQFIASGLNSGFDTASAEAVLDKSQSPEAALLVTGILGPASLRSVTELLAGVLVTVAGWISWRRNLVRDKEREQQIASVIAERTRAIKAEKEHVQDISRLKSQFVVNINHEIRTPMNGIVGGLELGLQTELTPEQREFLELSKTSAESLMAVLDDILEFSKTELD